MTTDPPSSDDYAAAGGYPIGIVATLTGLPVDVIRVWERRYGLPQPARSVGGHRLYRPRDVVLLRRAAALRSQGVTAAAACAQALAEAAAGSDRGHHAASPPLSPATGRLSAALYAAALALDAAQARTILDQAGALLDITTLWVEVVAPTLARVGTDWERGIITPAAEHLLSGVIRTRLSALFEALPRRAEAPRVLVGTAPGERHDLAALMLALLLGRAGWMVTYLGADTPREAWEESVRLLRPRVVVITATLPESAAVALSTLGWVRDRLGAQAPHGAFGGPGFAETAPLPGEAPDLVALGSDLEEAARRLAAFV